MHFVERVTVKTNFNQELNGARTPPLQESTKKWKQSTFGTSISLPHQLTPQLVQVSTNGTRYCHIQHSKNRTLRVNLTLAFGITIFQQLSTENFNEKMELPLHHIHLMHLFISKL